MSRQLDVPAFHYNLNSSSIELGLVWQEEGHQVKKEKNRKGQIT